VNLDTIGAGSMALRRRMAESATVRRTSSVVARRGAGMSCSCRREHLPVSGNRGGCYGLTMVRRDCRGATYARRDELDEDTAALVMHGGRDTLFQPRDIAPGCRCWCREVALAVIGRCVPSVTIRPTPARWE